MYDKIISRILNRDFLKEDKSFFEYPLLDFASEKLFLDRSNIHKLPQPDEIFAGKVFFVDGGSAEIVQSSDFGLYFIRVVAVGFKDKKKIMTTKNEFYVLISSVEKAKKLYYQLETYYLSDMPGSTSGDRPSERLSNRLVDEFSVDIFDKTMMFGGKRVELSCVCDLVRSLSEIRLASRLVKELDTGSVVVLDGNLENDKTHKFDYLKDLFESAEKKNVDICAVSKTCSIITNKARSVIPAILEFADDDCNDSSNSSAGSNSNDAGSWYYFPFCRSAEPFDLCFVRLNKASDHVFRLDFLKSGNLQKILAALLGMSNDLSFPGYPYGLIVADSFARISNKEKQYLMTVFKTKTGKRWDIVKKYVNTLNSHDVLDSMQ